jgi:hypothetical protein
MFIWLYSPVSALAASMNFPVSFQLLDLGQSAGLLGRVISSSQGLCLYTKTEKLTYNTNPLTSKPEAGFEPTITASERAKTVHALDLSANVSG